MTTGVSFGLAPDTWHLFQAMWYRSIWQPLEEFRHLLAAKIWPRAHYLFCRHVVVEKAPDLSPTSPLLPLLQQLQEHCTEIVDWHVGGGVYADFFRCGHHVVVVVVGIRRAPMYNRGVFSTHGHAEPTTNHSTSDFQCQIVPRNVQGVSVVVVEFITCASRATEVL